MRLANFVSRKVAEFRSWMRAMMHRHRLESEMEAELQNHLGALTADLINKGHSPADAARQARIALGPALMHKEGMRASLGLRWIDELGGDLRYAVRLLRKSPGFTLIAAISLALAIGANSTIFAVGRMLLFGRIAVPHPENLRLLYWTGDSKAAGFSGWGEWSPAPKGGTEAPIFPYPVYQQLRAGNHELGDLVAFKEDSMNATVRGDAQRAAVAMVSGNFYDEMQVRVELGRPIEPSDDVQQGVGTVVVISDSLWTQKYGRSPSALGQIVRVNQQPMTIIGVNPRGFTGVKGAMESPDLFVPITMQPVIDPKGKMNLLDDASMWWVNIVGRAKPGVKNETAQAAFQTRFAAAIQSVVKLKPGETMPKLEIRDGSRGLQMTNALSKPLYVLFAFTLLLLLLACVNVANLLLARGAKRQREINVRMAMGARRGRIVRQLFTESLLLAGLAGAIGLALSFIGRDLLPKLMENAWDNDQVKIPFDWRAFGFTVLVTFTTAVVFGLLPSWLAARNEVSSQLKESAQQTTRRRRAWSGKGIVAVQIALSTMLVIGAGVFLRTVMRLNSVDLGFDPNHVLMFDIHPPAKRYADGKDVLLHEQLEQKMAALPGVESVAPSWTPLAADSQSNSEFVTEDKSQDDANPPEFLNVVGNDYFHTMRIAMIAGRAFGPQDKADSLKVAVINEALARKRFPNRNPIGKRFRTEDGEKAAWIQVVGICINTRYAEVKDAPPPVFYLPYVQQSEVGGMTYQIRAHASAASLVPELHRIVQGIDQDLPMIDIRTEREQIDATMQTELTMAALTTAFGVLALVLASVGVYGIMAYTVSQRTNEIGIRLALGAERGQIREMVLRESTWITVAGLATGVVGALALVRLVKSMLFGIAPYDGVTLGCAVSVMLGVALAATWIPARRAASVQPMEALRHE
jgi:predicted permease